MCAYTGRSQCPGGQGQAAEGGKKAAKSYALLLEALDGHKELCSGLGCKPAARMLA